MYYAILSTDSGNNTGWTFGTIANYFALHSTDQGNNSGWIFLESINSSGQNGRNVIANAIMI